MSSALPSFPKTHNWGLTAKININKERPSAVPVILGTTEVPGEPGQVWVHSPTWLRCPPPITLPPSPPLSAIRLTSKNRVELCPGGSVGKESAWNAGDPGSIPGSGISPGGGNGNPLQDSCLENPMDRGAWWATVHGITESQTWLVVKQQQC